MVRRRQLMGMQTGGLPSEYRAVEYIGSTGQQKLDTGIKGDCTFDFTARCTEWSAVQIVLGRGFNAGQYIAKKEYWQLGGNNVFNQTSPTDWTNIHIEFVVEGSVGTATIDGVTKTASGGGGSTQNSSYCLFSDPARSYPSYVYISKCLCWKNGILVANFLPCVRKSDSKPGMYDTVSKTFFTNSGTGEFIIPT